MVSRKRAPLLSAESRLNDLGIELPTAPTPLGTYVEAVQTEKLLFLSGMLPVVDHKPAYVGTLGAGLDAKAGRNAARIAALNAIAAAKDHLGTIDRIKRVVRLGVFIATSANFAEHPAIADGASNLFRDVFGVDNIAVRSVIGVASLPLGVPVELEVMFELKK
jgi:enamine deaminase RidA (YjgF/YER057c/UK114 family)